MGLIFLAFIIRPSDEGVEALKDGNRKPSELKPARPRAGIERRRQLCRICTGEFSRPLAWALVFLGYLSAHFFVGGVPEDARLFALNGAATLCACWFWTDGRNWTGLIHAFRALFFLTVAGLALYAIFQYWAGSPYSAGMIKPPHFRLRGSAIFQNPNQFADLLAMLVPVMVCEAANPFAKKWRRQLCGGALACVLPALLVSQSRAGWLATFAGASVSAGLLLNQTRRWSMKRVILALVAAIGIILTALFLCSDIFHARFIKTMGGDVRLFMWKDTLAYALERPLLGHGGGAAFWESFRYQLSHPMPEHVYPHNEYLGLWADYGLVGLGVFMLIPISAGRWLIRCMRNGLTGPALYALAGGAGLVVARLTHAFFDFSFHFTASNYVMALFLGWAIADGTENAGPEESQRAIPFSRWPRWLARGVAVALLGLVAMAGYSSYLCARARATMQARDLAGAAEAYSKAAQWDKFNAMAWSGQGTLLVQSWNQDPGAWSESQGQRALAFFEETLRLNPWDTSSLRNIAEIHRRMGQEDQYLACLRRLVSIEPNNRFFRKALDSHLTKAGGANEAGQTQPKAVQ